MVLLTWPLMVAVQSVSARIGRVTGHGLASNMALIFPRGIVTALVLLLFVATRSISGQTSPPWAKAAP